ncbi:MAG: hypothetical protein WBA74_24905 [Cyclobacteriaceae bacterium]
MTSFGCIAQSKWIIAYNVLEDPASQDYEIYTMNKEGREIHNISNSKSIDWVYASYSDKLYFLSDRNECARCFHLYEMNADGSDVRKVFDKQLGDSWISSRKRGTEWIVKLAEPIKPTFLIIDLEGEILRKIEIGLAYANDPAFSPDGERIVFRGSTKSSPMETDFKDALYVMDLSSEKFDKITSHPADKIKDYRWQGYLAAAPRWRSDDRISYASQVDGNYDIYLINSDGSDKTSVTPLVNNQVYHHWHANGDLVFEASMNNHSGYELYFRSSTGQITQLTNDQIEQYAPVFVLDKQ